MDRQFWHQRWQDQQIGFHQPGTNPFLLRHFPALDAPPGGRVFIPLCGKTLDIHWLLANGYRVAGAELSPLAIDQLFAELGVTPRVSTIGALECREAEGITVFVGDIFDLTRDVLGAVDAIYDRAALVALPEPLRTRYAAHLLTLTGAAPQLLVCLEYDQSRVDGPPFSVTEPEVRRHYEAAYRITPAETCAVEGGLKGRSPAQESVWLLQQPQA